MLLSRALRGFSRSTRLCRASTSATRPRRARVLAWSSSSRRCGTFCRLGSSEEATAESTSRAFSPNPAAASSCACSCTSSNRSSCDGAACTSSARPASARFHLLSSRASMRTRSRRARWRRETISGSSKLGARPLARSTTSAVAERLQSRAKMRSDASATTRAFGAWLQFPRQPDGCTTTPPTLFAISSISSRTASPPARRHGPA
mmetsp:Transcript_11047/g.25580  ORF Transcript_11047/g.25580 Transcript_11047/m.25580 type:complete len:205 (-) Transcript_11047:380-994(-)